MKISVDDSAPILEELVARAEAGEEIIFVLDGRPAAQLKVWLPPT